MAYYQKAGLIRPSKTQNGKLKDGEERIDEIIAEIKPWYDNYCFSEDCYGIDPSMYNSNMVLYYLNNLLTTGKAPKEMDDPSSSSDYTQLKNLVELDRLDGNRKDVLMRIAEKGFIDASIVDAFDTEEMLNPDRFVSLLYYYGMLTIGGSDLDALHLVIPNNTIHKLYYDFMTEQFQTLHRLDLNELSAMYRAAALNDEWKPLFTYLADSYKKDSSIRDAIQGERNLQGYFNAYLHLSKLFIAHPEVEASHGYCDFFLLADTKKFPTLRHSYMVELKYLKAETTQAEVEYAKEQAANQLKKYMTDDSILRISADTQLHGIILVFRNGTDVVIDEA